MKLNAYPTVDIVAEEDAQINLTGQIQPIGKIIVSFINFSIDIGDLFFQIDDSESSLTISYCNIIRDAGNKAVNSHPLVIVNLGSLILNNLNIIGNNLEGSESLIQSSSPKLIQLTSLKVNNLAFTSESNQPLLLSATYDQTNSVKNEEHSIQPIILIENSEIIHNKLAPFLEASTVYLIGFTPQQILISNCTIDNRSPPNINKTYEFKIVLPLGSVSKDIISQFQTIEFGITLDPISVRILSDAYLTTFQLPLSEQYANIRVNSNGLESCTNYIANFRRDINTLSCVMIIIRSQESQGLLKGIARSISISGSFVENDLQTDGILLFI
ncbi:MAG: hypothetical protein EZS28_036761 [Streblomastix strix]|uniref:Uncharacterized protein n=1 Tax=Streblomastix strix TaxID=222440 RepID=A0A5J4UCX4_9EUKA|nr:MAG: hypothetical protein EZS28_036761 [Streblomastix strix]